MTSLGSQTYTLKELTTIFKDAEYGFLKKMCIDFYGYFIRQQLSVMLKQSPDSFKELKSVLSTISNIRDMSLDVELRFNDIQEKYRTLAMYKVQVPCSMFNHCLFKAKV